MALRLLTHTEGTLVHLIALALAGSPGEWHLSLPVCRSKQRPHVRGCYIQIFPVQKKSERRQLQEVADTLSCAAFGIANTVTALFFAIERTTKGLVEGGAANRPAWLNLSVHVLNRWAVAACQLLLAAEHRAGRRSAAPGWNEGGASHGRGMRTRRTEGRASGGSTDALSCLRPRLGSVIAWGDLLVSEERAFHGRSRHFAVAFALGYITWILIVRRYFGKVR